MNNRITLLPSSAKYKNARISLLIVLICSVLNLVLLFADHYFLFSARLSLVFFAVGMGMEGASGSEIYLIVGIVLAVISLVPYLLAWIFSKKHVGWMIAGLVYFAIDTVILAIDIPAYIELKDFSFVFDLLVHGVLLYEFAVGVKAGFAMKKEAAEAEAKEANAATAAKIPATDLADDLFEVATADAEKKDEESDGAVDEAKKDAPLQVELREVTFARKKSFVGCAIALVVYVDGVEVCRLKNGESRKVSVPTTAFELGAALSNGLSVEKQNILDGNTASAFTFQLKMGMTAAKILISAE